ncbi:unnamed protein product [Sphagnum jensenii]|uniref:Uncharacterized protein n=1 Tax=Sphagnum jensenii TaxID=128206 RepID=A0ABP0VNM0_9BRYO
MPHSESIPIPNVFQVLLHTSVVCLPTDAFLDIVPSTANPENQSRCSIVVSIPACHAGDPGSIPGSGDKRISLFSIVK